MPTSADSWQWMTAADLGRGIGAGRIDPRSLAEAYLAAIAAHPEAARIYARTTAARAMAEAEAAAARAKAGLRRGPLDGVPISWKDLFDTAGVATEAGSALLKDRVPDADAAVVASATRAGLVCLGKAHMSELAFSGLGVNPVTATPPNVHDAGLAPGGSSSGSAASVAFGLAAASIGSDTGGSVRVPSAWNDLVGLKTSFGRLPLAGVVPLCPRLDTVGPICRSVEDAALLLAALAGAPAADLAGSDVAGTRLLVCDTSAIGPNSEAQQIAFESALARLAASGAEISRARMAAAEAALPLSACISTSEAYGVWRDAIEADPDAMFFQIRDRFRAGKSFSAPDYVAAWRQLDRLRGDWRAATAGYDAVLMPTTPSLPPRVEALLSESAVYTTENLLSMRNTRIGNLLGLAALSLPTGSPSCGLMAMVGPGEEARLLRLGAAMERVLA